MTFKGQRIAREYRRLSNKKGGTSLERQGAENSTAMSENDMTPGGPAYIDDGLSASRYARKKRDDFDKLVADLQTGPTGRDSAFGADVLMLWESSRGSRKVGEWVDFIDLLEAKQVLIWVTTHERLYDPSNGRDRKSLLEDAVDSEFESYKTHRRTSSTIAHLAAQGWMHGAPPDGLMAVYDEKTGDLAAWVEDPDRSHIFQELFRLLEAGTTLTEIEGLFREAGHLNGSERPFSREHLRQSALKHAYAGLREFNGQVYDGAWDGIVPVKRFWAVQQILRSPHRRTTRTGRATHELTGRLWCARSNEPITRVRADTTYQCDGCGLRIQKEPVDDLIIGSEVTNPDGTVTRQLGALLQYLARDDIYERLSRPAGDGEELIRVQAELGQARAERDEFRQAKAINASHALILANSLDAKVADVRRLEEQERELSLPPAILTMIKPGVDAWVSWHEAPLSARRDVALIILSERYLGKAYIHPAARRGKNQTFIDRIEFRTALASAPEEIGADRQ